MKQPAKVCAECLLEKSISEFYKDRGAPASKCKACHSKRAKERRRFKIENDPEWVEKELARQRIKERKRRAAGICKIPSKDDRDEWARNHRTKHPLVVKARVAVNNAIKAGKLQRLPCAICESKKTEAHHDDYSKPLDVIWLCTKHHAERHVLLRMQERAKKFTP